MSKTRSNALILSVEDQDSWSDYGGHDIRLNGELVGYRPYDGKDPEEIEEEVIKALALMLRERLGWKASQ